MYNFQKIVDFYGSSILLRKGKPDETVIHCKEALRIAPDFEMAHVNPGNVFLQKDKIEEAIFQYKEALRIKLIDSTFLPDYHNDPFDRVLIAQANQNNFKLVTIDQIIKKYKVSVFWI